MVKILQDRILQNHLSQMLEIRYVALPSSDSSKSFTKVVQTKVRGSKMALRRGLLVQSIEIQKNI